MERQSVNRNGVRLPGHRRLSGANERRRVWRSPRAHLISVLGSRRTARASGLVRGAERGAPHSHVFFALTRGAGVAGVSGR